MFFVPFVGCVGRRIGSRAVHLEGMCNNEHVHACMRIFVTKWAKRRLDFAVRAEPVGTDSPPRLFVPDGFFPSTSAETRGGRASVGDNNNSIKKVKAQQGRRSSGGPPTMCKNVYRLGKLGRRKVRWF